MRRKPKSPEELGYKFYRRWIYRERPESRTGRTELWTPRGEFVCELSAEDVHSHIDLCIARSWYVRQLELGLIDQELR